MDKNLKIKDSLLVMVTSGRGPMECSMVCMGIASRLMEAAHEAMLPCRILNDEDGFRFTSEKNISKAFAKTGPENLLRSVVLEFKNTEEAEDFLIPWMGTILWIGKSPYRQKHKRKNWYVTIEYFRRYEVKEELHENDIVFESIKSSGPGGQHVNKTQSAVRARHLPSGITIVSNEERSQFANRRKALKRLKDILKKTEEKTLNKTLKKNWESHNHLERGNPVKIFQGEKFKEVRNERSSDK